MDVIRCEGCAVEVGRGTTGNRPASVSSGMLCATCALALSIAPAIAVLRARGRRRHADVTAQDQAHLAVLHDAIDDAVADMDERSRASGLRRAYKRMELLMERRDALSPHEVRALTRAWRGGE